MSTYFDPKFLTQHVIFSKIQNYDSLPQLENFNCYHQGSYSLFEWGESTCPILVIELALTYCIQVSRNRKRNVDM